MVKLAPSVSVCFSFQLCFNATICSRANAAENLLNRTNTLITTYTGKHKAPRGFNYLTMFVRVSISFPTLLVFLCSSTVVLLFSSRFAGVCQIFGMQLIVWWKQQWNMKRRMSPRTDRPPAGEGEGGCVFCFKKRKSKMLFRPEIEDSHFSENEKKRKATPTDFDNKMHCFMYCVVLRNILIARIPSRALQFRAEGFIVAAINIMLEHPFADWWNNVFATWLSHALHNPNFDYNVTGPRRAYTHTHKHFYSLY